MKAFQGKEIGGFKILSIKTCIHVLGKTTLYLRLDTALQRKRELQNTTRDKLLSLLRLGVVLLQLWEKRLSSQNQAALTNSSHGKQQIALTE